MITIAAIGTSFITSRTIAAAAGAPDVRFVGVQSRDADRAAALASELGLERSFGDLGSLLDSDVDAVYVASPNAVHGGQVRAAITAGKHVLCEKPAVTTAAEWDELCAAASEAGVVLLENMRTAYDPVMARILELLPSLGTLRRVSFSLSQRSARYDDWLAGRRPNVFDPALGGGGLADIGVYLTHSLVRLFGTPSRVSASFIKVPDGADGAGAALMTYDGMLAELAWSKITAGRLGGSIEGEQGTITLDHMTELGSLSVDYLDGRRIEERPGKEPDNITYALRRFGELVGSGGSAATDQAWTRASLALIESIRDAASL